MGMRHFFAHLAENSTSPTVHLLCNNKDDTLENTVPTPYSNAVDCGSSKPDNFYSH